MLSAIENGKVTDCPWRQADIVHLETTVDHVTAEGAPFVFYDRNATLKYSTPYINLEHLDLIAWDLLMEAPSLMVIANTSKMYIAIRATPTGRASSG